MGEDFERVRGTLLTPTGRLSNYYPSSGICRCNLRVVQHAPDDIVGVSDCESGGCEDVVLSASDIAVLELSWRKLGRAIAGALRFDFREADIGVPGARQIGAFSGASMPVVLAVQSSQSGFANAVVKMAWHLGEPFILLAPTNRFLDANAKATLQKARAGFFALDNILQVGANGLYAPKSAGELFSNYLPDSGHAVEEDVARQLFALVEQLESETSWRKAPILQVFRLYCRENLTRDEVGRKCGCVPSLISLRLKQIEERLGRKPSELRQFSSHFEKMEDSMSDSRARKIDRRAAVR